tara:strand:+ start:1080 stop:1376 length:297 start_codon:yes stop_codon:yes gene_type:complete
MIYQILNDADEVINTINAEESFVKANFSKYKLFVSEVPTLTADDKKEIEKAWRNRELSDTDWIVPISDHPQHAAYKTYRQKLRDWPSTSDFPDTRPTL